MKVPTLWFDKDGVLAQYDYSLYEPEFGAPAPWLVRNAHVFKGLDTYPNMCEAFKTLYLENCNKSVKERIANIKVLTAVSDSITLSEQVLDSMEWCKNNLRLKQRDFYAVAVPKESVPTSLRSKIDKYDILLDDYTPNLRAWKEAGGTAIKVLNGINSYSKDFPCINVNANVDYIIDVINQVLECIKDGKEVSTVLVS